jgi:hypothetical protein
VKFDYSLEKMSMGSVYRSTESPGSRRVQLTAQRQL